MLTSRERVLYALNHEEPDRVPLFIGTSGATTLLVPAYERLKAHLGLQAPQRVLSRTMQYARMDEEVLLRLGSDGRVLQPLPSLSADSGPAAGPQAVCQAGEPGFTDEWGTRWIRRPGIDYYEVFDAPLRHAGLADLERYPWPDLASAARFAGLAAEARRLHEETPFAVVGMSGVAPWETAYVMRGLDAILADLIEAPDFVQALLRKISDCMLAGVRRFLAECGPYIDVLITGDDLGMQSAPMMSPRLYRKLIKPFHAELLAAIHSLTKAKVFFHSDGDVYPLIGDLIEVGVDLLNPVQVSAGQMADTARLKREFGAHLAFCGAIDTQWALPFGTPDDVRREVRRRMTDLAPGGGYVVASVHCIQPDVSPENVLAMCDEVAASGRYPLRALA